MKENTKNKITKKTQTKNNGEKSLENGKSLTEYFTSPNQNMGNSERVVSTVAGGSLVAYGIKRKDWLGALLGSGRRRSGSARRDRLLSGF